LPPIKTAKFVIPVCYETAIVVRSKRTGLTVTERVAMQPISTTDLETTGIARELPIAPGDLEKLARWVPTKEMALLVEICDRARLDPDLTRPALLLCSAYGKRVAHMLDQDPFPAVTQTIAERLRKLQEQSGL
jgi:hypothetical protein